MQDLRSRTISEIALEAPLATTIFEEYKIDYCCGGRKSFPEACRSAGADPDIVMQKIDLLLVQAQQSEPDWLKTASLGELITYICDKHHSFTREEIANLTPLMAKVAGRHGEKHPELGELARIFNGLCQDLSEHLLKEERILFPYIEQLERSVSNQAAVPLACFGTVENPVRVMMTEHDSAGDFLREMRNITHHYLVPENACLSFATLFRRLEGLERDLHQHIHLENNLLFPKAVELEARVFDRK
jgi:regulator of cell morphogenesis and NO signaling